MTIKQPQYSKEEFAQKGDEIYQNKVIPQLKAEDKGKIVAIDLKTEDFEINSSEIEACNRLESRHPNAQIWIVCIGSRHVRRFGGRGRK